jgi:rhodanese-related sulfurtransferase
MKKRLFAYMTFIFLAVGTFTASALSADAPRMTMEELKALLGSPDLIVVDVRADNDWKDSDSIIKGAVREDPGKIGSWEKNYSKEKTLVFYCA